MSAAAEAGVLAMAEGKVERGDLRMLRLCFLRCVAVWGLACGSGKGNEVRLGPCLGL
jgi:hypothetical protein